MLYKYQQDALDIMKTIESKSRGGILADEKGLGKMTTMISYLKLHKSELPILIITPHIPKWEERIREIWKEKNDNDIIIVITNDIDEKHKSTKWSRVILDDFGNNNKEFKLKSLFNWCISRVMGNDSYYCKFIGTSPYNKKKWWKTAKKEEIKAWKDNFVIHRKKSDVLSPIIHKVVSINAYTHEKQVLNGMKRDVKKSWIEWKEISGIDKINLQAHIISSIQRLRASTNCYYEENAYIKSSKVRVIIDHLSRIIDKYPDGIVIYSQFISFLTILKSNINTKLPHIKVFALLGTNKNKIIDEFGKYDQNKVLLTSCDTTNIPSTAMYICEANFNDKMEDIIHNINQNNIVYAYTFIMINSIDTWVNNLKKKNQGKKIDTFSFDDIQHI